MQNLTYVPLAIGYPTARGHVPSMSQLEFRHSSYIYKAQFSSNGQPIAPRSHVEILSHLVLSFGDPTFKVLSPDSYRTSIERRSSASISPRTDCVLDKTLHTLAKKPSIREAKLKPANTTTVLL